MTNVYDPKIKYRTPTGWLDALTGEFTPVAFPRATAWNDDGLGIAANVGVDGIPGWTPAITIEDDTLICSTEGAVVEDVRVINGGIRVDAPNVTIRRCEIINGSFFNDYGAVIGNGVLYEDCTTRADPPGALLGLNTPWSTAGYTCNRCAILLNGEGWHTGNSGTPLADPDHPDGYTVRLYNCYAEIISQEGCGIVSDYHGDVLQAYDGGGGGVPLVIRNCTLRADPVPIPDCHASAHLGMGVTQAGPADIDGVFMHGASAVPLHADCGGKFRNIYITEDCVDIFAVAIDVYYWSITTVWDRVVLCDGITADGQPGPPTASVPYGWPGFGPLDPPPDD
jgi:hypothetical protein